MYKYDRPRKQTSTRINIITTVAYVLGLGAIWFITSIILIGLGASY